MRRDYRLLKPGEPIQDGDEFLSKLNPGANWIPFFTDGVNAWAAGIMRRPATGPAAAGQMIEVLEVEIAFLRKLLAQKE